jgi:hypothetical protein
MLLCSLRSTCAVAALAMSAFLPSLASAEVYHYRSSGPGASAGFSDFTSGCIASSVGLSVSKGRYTEGEPEPSLGAYLNLFIVEYDLCTGEEYPVLISERFALVPIPVESFQTQGGVGGLQSASLQVTVDTYNEFTGNVDPVTIDLTWTGMGPVTHGHHNENVSYPHIRQILNFLGTQRNATVSGSVIVDGRDLVNARLGSGTLSFMKYAVLTVVRSDQSH